MARLAPVKFPNGATVYLEVDEDAQISEQHSPADEHLPQGDHLPDLPGEPVGRGAFREKGLTEAVGGPWAEEAERRARQLTETIQGIAAMIPEAFRSAVDVDIEKLTLSFDIKLGGQMSVPFLAKAEGEGNIGVVVECRYPARPDSGRGGSVASSAGAPELRDRQ
jgi:hypothetical protein